MRNRSITSWAAVAAAFMLMAGVVLGFGGSVSALDMAMASHPAHIHVGECATAAEVVFPLSNVGDEFNMDGTPMAGMGGMLGPAPAIPVEAGVAAVQAALADIVAGGHSIVLHESDLNIANYITCGAIGGTMLGERDLRVGLAPLNDSGYSGIAWLHDNLKGTTTVYIFVNHSGGMMGVGMATPTS